MPEVIEVRCPVGPRRLFSKLKLGEEFGAYVEPGNLIEFTCSDCARRLSRERQQPLRVYHRFNFLGELIETTVERRWVCISMDGSATTPSD
jgi:hypothetical protein